MQRHWFVGLWCTSALVAQATRAPELQLPKLLRLGPVPTAVPVTTIGDPDAAIALPPAAKAVQLRADQGTPMARVQAALDALAAHGVEQVFLLAQLPDGTPGTLVLALPNAGAAPPTVVLRAHHDRPGVPPESAVPVLRRLGDGWHAAGRGTFVLGITLPADATHAQLLGLLATAANAQLRCATVQTTPASQQPAAALALDLEASFVIQVQAREQVPVRPGLQDTPFGLLERAATTAIELPGGRAGGRYGGRGGQAKPAADEGRLALERALPWLLRQQRADGSFPGPHAIGDVEATALVSLVLLSRGQTLDGGPDCDPLRRSIGWLLARQHDDGRFADFGPNATRHHALATFALTEAAGLSAKGPLFQPCAQLALDWLFTQQRDDGGWNDGTPGAASDALSTATAMAGVGSAAFFRLRAPSTPKELIAWFDAHPGTTPTHAAAELFCRFFAGQSPATAPLAALADRVVTADASDPATCYWATYALFQMGGAHWQQWTERMGQAALPLQATAGEGAGSWPASAGDPQVTTTARFTLALAACYRYSRIVTR